MDEDLRAFIAIAEASNLTAAAERIGISQPSLTKRLRLIEANYGSALFERLPRGMKLTALGTCLYQHAKKIETAYARAREEFNALKSGHLEVLRVGATLTFHLLHISRILDQLRREFPKTRLVLTAASNEVMLPQLIKGELDVVVGQIRPVEADKEVIVRRVATFEYCVVVGRRYAVRGKAKVPASDLKDYSWISYGGNTELDANVIEYFRASGLNPPELVVSTSSFTTALQLVVLGKYAMMTSNQLKSVIEAAGAVACRINIPLDRFEAGLYVRRPSMRYPIVRRFSDILDTTFEKRA
jgi:DNA-binding transcriptional LysR family regulator